MSDNEQQKREAKVDTFLQWLENASHEDILNIPPLSDEEKEQMRGQGIDPDVLEREPTEEELAEFHRRHPGFTDRVLARINERKLQQKQRDTNL